MANILDCDIVVSLPPLIDIYFYKWKDKFVVSIYTKGILSILSSIESQSIKYT